MSAQIIECVPNFSEGRDENTINAIAAAVKTVAEVTLLDVDPGKDTNRTVFTFAGPPAAVVEAAFKAIGVAAQLIDMTTHTGAHPRMGATDVCPLIPIAGISLAEVSEYANELARRVSAAYNIPTYMYEASAKNPERRNLANIRSGEYEGLKEKLSDPNWKPDYGEAIFNAKSGATVIGARDFLIAYNVNLNTDSVKKANSVAFDVREKGRVKKINGVDVLDAEGNPVRIPGKLKDVKAIGWFIPEYGFSQISMNLTNPQETSIHDAFMAIDEAARERGLKVTGSELVGMVPKQVMVDAGKYFQKLQNGNIALPERDLIRIAVRSLGLEELGPFDPEHKIIEYSIEKSKEKLIDLSLEDFTNRISYDTPTPGGGSAAAYIGAVGSALGAMVANLSQSKKGLEKSRSYFMARAEVLQSLKQSLLHLVDADTDAYNEIITAIRMPKETDAEKKVRGRAITNATKTAIETPLATMKVASDALPGIIDLLQHGNPSSFSDAAVGLLCVETAINGAYFNVKINLKDVKDAEYSATILAQATEVMRKLADTKTEIQDKINRFFDL